MVERNPYQKIIEIGADAFEVIARASGEKPHDDRWTVLAIYRRRETAPADYPGPFVAKIVGETRIEGEERRERRGSFESVLEALSWGAFNARSALFGELRRKAMGWLERRTLEAEDATKMRFAFEGQPMGGAVIEGTLVPHGRHERAIALLRELMEAANSEDDDRMDRAIYAAAEFLEEVDNAAG